MMRDSGVAAVWDAAEPAAMEIATKAVASVRTNRMMFDPALNPRKWFRRPQSLVRRSAPIYGRVAARR